jgi:type III pantothenate kinase
VLLVLDIGNSTVVAGIYEGEELRCKVRTKTNPASSPDALGSALRSALEAQGLDVSDVDAVAISTVVPELTPSVTSVAQKVFGCEPLFLTPELDLGITIAVDRPELVGSDRIADAIATKQKYGGPAVIVDFGTATTVDGIDAQGTYVGGAIAPGLEISLDALVTKTALLPRVDLVAPPEVLSRDTVTAMQSGLVLGYVGLVEALVAGARSELGGAAKVIATGGLASLIHGWTKVIDVVDDSLTLDGIRIAWERSN